MVIIDKNRFFLVLVLFFIITAEGLVNAAPKSLTGWMLFRKVQSSRPKAISSTSYFQGNTSGVFYNPSLLAMVQGSEVDVFSAIGAVDEKMAGSIYCWPCKNSLSLSVGILTYDYGKVALNWIEDDQIKERIVSAQTDYLAMFAAAKPLTPKLNAGISLKLATSRIAETASATAVVFDGGITYLPYKKLTLSLVGQNFGLATRFIDEKDKLPRTIMAGLNYFSHFESFYLISGLEVPYLIDESRTIPSIGFELGRWPFGIFASYRFYTLEAKFSAGISITVKNYEFNYSYTPAELFDSMHRLSVGVKLDPLPDKREAIVEENRRNLSFSREYGSTKKEKLLKVKGPGFFMVKERRIGIDFELARYSAGQINDADPFSGGGLVISYLPRANNWGGKLYLGGYVASGRPTPYEEERVDYSLPLTINYQWKNFKTIRPSLGVGLAQGYYKYTYNLLPYGNDNWQGIAPLLTGSLTFFPMHFFQLYIESKLFINPHTSRGNAIFLSSGLGWHF